MDGSVFLSKALDVNEIEQLSSPIKDKLELYLGDIDEKLTKAKFLCESLRVNSEQQYNELERKLIETVTQLESESSAKTDITQRLTELEKKLSIENEKISTLQANYEKSHEAEIKFTKLSQQLEGDKKELSEVVNKKDKKIDSLNEEWKRLTEKISSGETLRCEVQAKLSEYQSRDVTREFKEKKLIQERDQLLERVDWLNNQVNEKSNIFINERKEKSVKLLELMSQLEVKTEELSHTNVVVDGLKKTNADQTIKINELIQKLKDARDAQMQSDEQFRQEIKAQTKLVNLYKDSAGDNEQKVDQMMKAIEDMQKLLREAAEDNKDVKEHGRMEIEQYSQQIEEKESKIENLEEELRNANDLIVKIKGEGNMSVGALETLYPTAAATSKILKSGMTLTEIYSEYVKVSDGLQVERAENSQLRIYLDEIGKELEEKAPLLVRQREDYEAALQSNTRMAQQLNTAMVERENLLKDRDQQKRKANFLERETQRLQQQTIDLGRQVKRLIQEISELKGGPIIRESSVVSSSADITSADVVSENLVTFRNVEELQEQNQRLLTLVREMSEKKEHEELEAVNMKTEDLKQQLETALTELNNLQSGRQRQEELVKSIVRQRDMYKIMLQNSANTMLPGMSTSELCTSSPVKGGSTSVLSVQGSELDKQLTETKEALKELQSQFTMYRQEKNENEKILNEQIETSRNRESELRVNNAKLSSRLDFSAERNKVQQSNIESYKKEITALSNRCQKYSSQVMKLEQTVNTLRDDLMAAQENLSRFEIQNQNLRSEKDLLKNSERHMLQEMERIRRENSSQNMVMLNLQAIQNNLERADFENKTRLNQQIENKDKEVASIRRKLENIQDEHQSTIRHWESLVRTLQTEVTQEREGIRAEKAKIDKANDFINNLRQNLSTTEAKLAAAEIKLSNSNLGDTTGGGSMSITAVSMSIDEIKDLKSQLTQANAKIKNLEKSCEDCKQQLEQYKKIASNVEQSIKQQNQTSEEFQQALEKRMEESSNAKENLKLRIEALEKENQDVVNQNVKISEEAHNLNADLRKQLASVQTELISSVERRESAITNESSAIIKCEQQSRIAAEAQDKYERELILHAADVEALVAIKQQLENINEPLIKSQEEVKKLEQRLLESQTSWAEQERLIKEESKMLAERCTELSNQNKMLHEQMIKLSGQVSTIHQKSTDPANMSMSEEREKSSDQLLEVIRFLRREKEIAEMKMEVAEIECNRLKQRFEHLQKQLNDSNTALIKEREESQVALQTASQHAEIMKKIENVNILTDSNKLLREERDRLKHEQVSMEARIKKMEGDINPIQANIRDLESEKDVMTAERVVLQGELNRWKSRTNHLIERCNKTDPEELKRTIQEKDNLKRQISSLTEENVRHKAEISKLNSSINSLQTDLNTLRQEHIKQSQQVTTLQAQHALKQASDKTITQLKKIGRKYKEQVEKITKEYEDYKIKIASETPSVVDNTVAIEQAKAELTGKLTSVEKERNELKTKVEELTQEIERFKEQINEFNTEKTKFDESSKKYQDDITEYEKKQTQSRNVLSTARSKITSQKEQIERLNSETNDLKMKLSDVERQTKEEGEMRFNTLKSQYEGRINRLETELTSLRSTSVSTTTDIQQNEQLIKENTELQTKIQQLQKQVENLLSKQQQQVIPQQQVTRTPVTMTTSISTSDSSVKTANIRPMGTTATVPVRPSTPIQHSSAGVKVTASIRPMAIASSTSTGAITPTATVMPTTVSQPESVDEQTATTAPSSIPASFTPRMSTQIQIVTPQIETTSEVVIEPTVPDSTPVSPVLPTTSQDITTITSPVTPQPVASQPVTHQPITPQVITHQGGTPQPSTSGTQIVTPQPSGLSTQLGKRPREDTDSQEESDTFSKRTRTTSQEQGIPGITVTDEHAQTITHLSPQTPSTSVEVSPLTTEQNVDAPLVPILPTNLQQTMVEPIISQRRRQAVAPRNQQQIDDDDDDDDGVIVLESDDEEQVYQEQMEDNRSGEDISMKAYTESMEDDEDYDEYDDDDDDDDEDDDDDDDDDDIRESNQDDDDVVVIIVDDGEGQRRGSDEIEQQSSTIQASVPSVDVPRPPTNLQTMGRSQLTPFMLGNQPGQFDEEDGLVPSTPTLSIPIRRADGFAEAINSPAGPQRFVFGTEGTVSQPELAQLESQRALGMDDTRIDLSQFDEGRSPVPASQLVPRSGSVSTDIVSTVISTSTVPSSESNVVEIIDATQEPDPIEYEEEGDGLLEGIQGPEDATEDPVTEEEPGDIESSDQAEGGAGTSADLSQDDDKATGDSNTGNAGRPKIQRIVWGQEGTSAPSSQTMPPGIQSTRGRMARRGRGGAWRGPGPRSGTRGSFR